MTAQAHQSKTRQLAWACVPTCNALSTAGLGFGVLVNFFIKRKWTFRSQYFTVQLQIKSVCKDCGLNNYNTVNNTKINVIA